MQACLRCLSVEAWTGPSANREEEMAFVTGSKLFSRPTSCDLGFFFFYLHVFGEDRGKETEAEPPRSLLLQALGEEVHSSGLTWVK